MEQKLQKMMKKYPLFIGMGFMIVMLSLIIGAINAGSAADYYAVNKAVRDTSSQWAAVRAGVESTTVWLPYFKFMGLAMILAGITMALGIIATTLEKLGKEVMDSVPQNARVTLPGRPATVMLMRMFMMVGMLIIIVGFIISINIAGIAATVFSNTIQVIDGAAAGSALLTNLATIHAAEAWLEAFKFVGVAFFFMGIVNGLATIIFALRYQQHAIPEVVDQLPAVDFPAGMMPSPTD